MSLIRTVPFAVALSLSLFATAAHAQDPKAPATPADTGTDHDKVVGGFGASYFGQFNVPFGTLGQSAPTQLVGVRYWVTSRFGIDGGIGILTASGSTKSGNTTVDTPSLFGMSFKAGVPIAMLTATHYTFFIEPQAIFGFASRSTRPVGGDETKDNGTHIALGATAGAEVQFGFMGLPHLALDATIGLGLDMTNASSKTGAAAEKSESATNFGTAAFASPWNIFTTNVAARYYF